MKLYVDGSTTRCAYYFEDGRKGIVPLSKCTNNEGEYYALIRGLHQALVWGIEDLEIYSDSQLMVLQLVGHYKIKKPELRELADTARRWMTKFNKITLCHVLRENNPAGKMLEVK